MRSAQRRLRSSQVELAKPFLIWHVAKTYYQDRCKALDPLQLINISSHCLGVGFYRIQINYRANITVQNCVYSEVKCLTCPKNTYIVHFRRKVRPKSIRFGQLRSRLSF